MVLALPHSGNWDAAGAWLADWLGEPFLTIAERLKPESLYRRFLDLPRVPRDEGHPAHRRARSRARRCSAQWLNDGGVELPAGRPQLRQRRRAGDASSAGRRLLPSGAALLAARTGAALLPAVPRFDGAGWRIQVHPEVPVTGEGRLAGTGSPTAMQAVADVFTDGLGEHPEDWHMLGRIWSDVPPDAPRRAAPGERAG